MLMLNVLLTRDVAMYKKVFVIVGLLLTIAIAFACGYRRGRFEGAREIAQMKREIYYAQEYVSLIRGMRDRALEASPADASAVLFQLQEKPFRKFTPVKLGGSRLTTLVSSEARRASGDIIDCLRKTTGKELGQEPGPWILEYGNEGYRADERELLSEIPLSKSANLPQ